MRTIRRLEVVPWAIPLRRPLPTARGAITHRRGALLRLEDSTGTVGLGEAAPHPFAPPQALDATLAVVSGAAAWLVGAALDRWTALLSRARALEPAAAAGIDMALHDLAARAQGVAVCELIGAGVARGEVESSALIDAVDPAAAGAAAAAAAGLGYRAVKLKVGRDLPAAVLRLTAVAAAAPALSRRADANGAFDAATAVEAARALRPLGLEWLEQPTPAGDDAGLASVRRETGVCVAADESVTGPAALARLADAGAVDVAVLKLVQVGGLAAAMETARLADERGIDVSVTTSIDTSVATAAALHLAAALPRPPRLCGLATLDLLAGDLAIPPLATGPRMAPAGPGLGIRVDDGALARWRT